MTSEDALHRYVRIFEVHSRVAHPAVVQNARTLHQFMADQRPTNNAMLWLYRHALDGAVNKAIFGLDEARHIITLCSNTFEKDSFKDTEATRAVHDVRNNLAAHSRVVRTGRSGQAKFEKITRLYAGSRIFDLLEAAGSDLSKMAAKLVAHPKFTHGMAPPRPTASVTTNELTEVMKCLRDAGLY
jgi:hypothetical protein